MKSYDTDALGWTAGSTVPTLANNLNPLGVNYTDYPVAILGSFIETNTNNSYHQLNFYTNSNTGNYNVM